MNPACLAPGYELGKGVWCRELPGGERRGGHISAGREMGGGAGPTLGLTRLQWETPGGFETIRSEF